MFDNTTAVKIETPVPLFPKKCEVVRETSLLPLALFVGGHPGCGKTMLTPILGGMERVEIQKYNYALEHICCLGLLNKMEKDAASVMIRMLTDLDIYNMMMSRETNFRFKDLSSIFKNPNPWRYFRRLFFQGDAEVVARIKKEKPILQITTHNLLFFGPLLLEALGARLRMIELVRHPLYMIKQWRLYIDLYGTDPRDFTIWIGHQNHALPFFAYGWEEKFLRSNPMDRAIYSIAFLMQREEEVLNSISEKQKSQLLLIPFEHFVIDPWPFMGAIEKMLGTCLTSAARREMKKQHVPRNKIADGINRAVYRKNGWEPSRGGSEAEELKRRRDFVAAEASPEAMQVLDQLCDAYEKKYDLNYRCNAK